MSVERGEMMVVIAGIPSIMTELTDHGFCAYPWFEDVHRLPLAMKPVDLSIFAIERFREVVLVLRMYVYVCV